MTKDTSWQQTALVSFLVEDRYRIYRHLIVLGYLITTEFSEPIVPVEFSGSYTLYLKVIKTISFLLLVYINMYLLVPKFLFKDKYFKYFGILVSLILIFHISIEFFFQGNFESYHAFNAQNHSNIFMSIVANLNLWVVIILSSTSIKLFQRWREDTIRMTNLEKNSLESELGELKNQLNPHFLFNVLNNVNTLLLTEPKVASVIVMKLSGFLRHLLYENNKSKVSLYSEIKFLNDFLELENIRRDEFSFSITKPCPEKMAFLTIPPNLFLIFVENAVKHSRDPYNHSEINIAFEISENQLTFTCFNTKSPVPSPRPEVGGLGLTNIQRRLDLLYRKNHILDIDDTTKSYKITLNIPL